ncbi:PilZ domain-containing protein [bacterium]|nr:PilZ domain-containing protein [bacterium]MCG2676545.1 PilZ domain-containing protein [bacterium]MCG2677186.1 PilZ domain-containing protein [bacterium]
MEKKYEGPNRREAPRIIKPIPVRYMLPLDFSGGTWEASTHDIGGGGLRIGRKNPVKEGTIAALEITLPTEVGGGDKVKTIAQVVWCHKVGKEEDYSVGLKFILPDDVAQKKISRYVEEESERLKKEINPGG